MRVPLIVFCVALMVLVVPEFSGEVADRVGALRRCFTQWRAASLDREMRDQPAPVREPASGQPQPHGLEQGTSGPAMPDTFPSGAERTAERAAVPAGSGDGAPDGDGPGAVVPQEVVITGTLRRGETLAGILDTWVHREYVQPCLKAVGAVFPLRSFRAGNAYTLVCDAQGGAPRRFVYEVDQRRRLVAESGETGLAARLEKIPYDVRLALLESRVDDNLFKSVARLGESPQLALLLAGLFACEINFVRDIQDDDSFSVLVEKLYRDGQFRGYGRTLGATFTNKGKTFEAFLFHDRNGHAQYYNDRGENLKKTLLQAPLPFTRVTSGYSHNRRHPIFGDRRPHLGVDYGAPAGTPVRAVGKGVVSLRGWVGGYGNQVIIRHSGGLESLYAHLSRFAPGLARGSQVRQGQIIGYVGSTGYATGPHLDFRLRQNGRFINPAKAINPRDEAVNPARRAAFAERKALVRAYMRRVRPLASYRAESTDPMTTLASNAPDKSTPGGNRPAPGGRGRRR